MKHTETNWNFIKRENARLRRAAQIYQVDARASRFYLKAVSYALALALGGGAVAVIIAKAFP